jgi:hypothetical protein
MDQHPTGYIVSNAEDLLSLFDADYGVLVIGEGAKIMGSKDYGQDILLVAEYLRVKQFTYAIYLERILLSRSWHSIVCSKSLNASRRTIQTSDYHPAWMLFRASSTSHYQSPDKTSLCFSEKARSAECTGLVDLFIEVWREKESALQSSQVTSILLSNASHEGIVISHQFHPSSICSRPLVRTPLN